MLLLIWSIVKFILLFLLILLLVLLALAALVLLVPFCYQVGAEVDSERIADSSGRFQVSWLGRFLFLSGVYTGSGLTWSLKILGIRVMPRKPKTAAVRIQDRDPARSGQDTAVSDDRQAAEEDRQAAEGNRRRGQKKKRKKSRVRRKAGRRTGHPAGTGSAWKRAAGFMRVLAQEENRQVLARVFHRVVKVLRHIAPRRAEGTVSFGLTDPSHTGMLLGLAGMCLPAVGMHLSVHPDFQAEKNSFSARVQLSGHIILAVLAARLLPLVLDKEVRRTYRRIRSGGDE